MAYSPKPRSDVFCFKLNFKISKWGYYIKFSPLATPWAFLTKIISYLAWRLGVTAPEIFSNR